MPSVALKLSRSQSVSCLCGILLLFGWSVVGAAEDNLIHYAEHQRLATRSLLMDVLQTRQGDFVAVGERGHVVVSSDGIDWSQAEVVPTRATLTVVTEHNGRLWAAGHDTEILSSGDGGDTWTRHHHDAGRDQPIMDLVFIDDQRGIAIGAYGLILQSTDGGESWQDGVVSDEEWHLNALLNLGEGRLMIAGEAGFSYRSLDGGQSWETLNMPYPGSMFGIVAADEDCILVYGLRGHAQQSCDFGNNWSEVDSGNQTTISGATVAGDMLILVGNSGLVLQRTASGSYETDFHSSGVDFSEVIPLTAGRFLLVGEEGVHYYPETAAGGAD